MTATPDEPAEKRSEVKPSLIDGVTVDVAGDEMTLAALMKDIEVAHKELNEYKNGGLVAQKALDEKIAEATINGDDELKELLIDVKDSAFGVYLRVQYGDLELMGNRYPESEYHGWFADE